MSLLATVVACSSHSEVPSNPDAPPGDYGDAPDGKPLDPVRGGKTGAFPTASKDAGRVLDVNKAWLGAKATVEAGADDPRDPDGRPNLEYDRDDGLTEMMVALDAGKATAELTLDVVVDDASQKYWLNVLVDLNGDGRWGGSVAGGADEWAVQNFAVDMGDKRRARVKLPKFAFENGADVPESAWMRVALTNALAPKAWDGSGQFAAGEIEDYLVELPDAPLVDVDCMNPESGAGSWTFDGQRTSNVTCHIDALNEKARSEVPFVTTRVKGGVTHSGLCRGAKIDEDSSAKEVRGTIDLRQGGAKVSCLFVKEWGLPSQFDFRVPAGRETSKLTARGVEVGLSGTNHDTLTLEKGDCLSSCRSSRQCIGSGSCNGSCCVPPWADTCGSFDTAGCGRCCAIAAGAQAADCVREACVH
jgi:hypothetical protein